MATEAQTVIDGELIIPDTSEQLNAGDANEESQALEQPAAKSEVVYDADAQQRVQFRTERRGRMYLVTHIFQPLIEDAVLDYERQRSQTLSDANADEAEDQDATAITSKGYKAALNYWNNWGARAEGYVGKISDRDKAFAVGQLFGVEFQDLPLANDEELCPPDDDENSTHILRCLFDSNECYVSATLRPPTDDEIEEFESLQARALLVQGKRFGEREQKIPAKSKRLGELFDRMKVSVHNYKRRVPLHHKAAYALRHLRAEQKAITGN